MTIFKDNKKDCLNDIQIVSYALKKCSDKEHKEIEAHIAKCNRCFNEVVSLIKAQPIIMDEKQWGEALDLTAEKEKILKIYNDMLIKLKTFVIVVQLAKKQLVRLINHNGNIYHPVRLLSAQRGSASEEPSKAIPTIFKIFNGYRAEVKIETKGDEAIDIHIKVKKAQIGTLVPQVTFMLIEDKETKELAEFTRDGTISFQNLKPGEYTIKIIKSGKFIGIIALNLKAS